MPKEDLGRIERGTEGTGQVAGIRAPYTFDRRGSPRRHRSPEAVGPEWSGADLVGAGNP